MSFDPTLIGGGAGGDGIYRVRTRAPGPQGRLPLTEEMLRERPSGDLFGLTQNVGMGWNPEEAGRKPFLILSTQGGVRSPDGTPVALGYHTGHWEIGLLVEAAAREIRRLEGVPFAAYCSDPCDGRTQGTVGMFDSLPYRNDAANLAPGETQHAQRGQFAGSFGKRNTRAVVDDAEGDNDREGKIHFLQQPDALRGGFAKTFPNRVFDDATREAWRFLSGRQKIQPARTSTLPHHRRCD